MNPMKKFLLIMSTSGYSPETVTHAIQKCKENNAELLACYIIDAEIPEAVSSWMIYVGFMGDEPSEDYRNIVLEEYKDRARETLEELSELAKADNISIQVSILEGGLLENTIAIAKKENVDLIVINKTKRTDFSRLLHGSVIEDLKKQAPCPVEVIDK